MKITLPSHKTKIICTIGPASRSEEVLERLMMGGMSIARLNFSHGSLEQHRNDISTIRSVARRLGRSVAILVDLPGPKIRIGHLETEPIVLEKGAELYLTTRDVPGTSSLIPVSYKRLPESVFPGSVIYLNDGFIELRVVDVSETDVMCTIEVDGQILSGKGLNLPGAKIFLDTPTDRDLDIMKFALDEGIDTFGISFAESADDIIRAKEFAAKRGKTIHTIAKIERAGAVDAIEDILEVTDGIMIARGDLGVEIPIEKVPAVQKKLIRAANLCGRPVITATQLLESMVDSTRPTRAEATDVANAILDGTDAVMLSEETAIGRYPVETVSMMARIAREVEHQRRTMRTPSFLQDSLKEDLRNRQINVPDTISLNVFEAARALNSPFILTPTTMGTTPRRISRMKPESWILAFNNDQDVCNFLMFSYGVYPIVMATDNDAWHEGVIEYLKESGRAETGDRIILTEGKFFGALGGTDSLAIVTVS
jgi:pyruvate kinase